MALFSTGSNNFSQLKERLGAHQDYSESQLHSNHPHLGAILTKHGINLKQIRRRASKAIAAAAVLGAFLAVPHLIGQPNFTPPASSTSSGKEISQSTPTPNHLSTSHQINQHNIGSSSPTQTPANPPVNPPTNPTPTQGHQGHIHGRSYLAPPKDHGLHDLGLHKGEEKNPQVPDNGPHPSGLSLRTEGENK